MATTIGGAGIAEKVAEARASFRSGRTRPESWRRAQLEALKSLLKSRGQTHVSQLVIGPDLDGLGKRLRKHLRRMGVGSFDNEEGVDSTGRHFAEVCLQDIESAERTILLGGCGILSASSTRTNDVLLCTCRSDSKSDTARPTWFAMAARKRDTSRI